MPTTATFLPGPAFQCLSGEYVVMPAQSSGAATSSERPSGMRSDVVLVDDDLAGVAAVGGLAVLADAVVRADAAARGSTAPRRPCSSRTRGRSRRSSRRRRGRRRRTCVTLGADLGDDAGDLVARAPSGRCASPQSSRAWWMSEWQMPANLMSIRTSLRTVAALDGGALEGSLGAAGDQGIDGRGHGCHPAGYPGVGQKTDKPPSVLVPSTGVATPADPAPAAPGTGRLVDAGRHCARRIAAGRALRLLRRADNLLAGGQEGHAWPSGATSSGRTAAASARPHAAAGARRSPSTRRAAPSTGCSTPPRRRTAPAPRASSRRPSRPGPVVSPPSWRGAWGSCT